MQEVIISVILLLLFFSIILVNNQKKAKKRLILWIKQQFGKIPKRKEYDFERIACYWNEIKDNIPEDEKLDDITWNDLEMNNIYARINQCKSFVGEQLLYSTLHSLKKNATYVKSLEEKINLFSNNEELREVLQVQLHGIGKKDNSYYLPMFLSNLEVVGISKMWLYRCLQVLLAASFLPAIIFANPIYLIISAIMLLINMIIYTVKRMEYEVYLEALTSISGILTVASNVANFKLVSNESLFHDFKEEARSFKNLSKKISSYQQRKKNSIRSSEVGILIDFMMGATFLDFVKYNQIVHILKDNQNDFMNLFQKVGELDMMISIASFRASIPFYCVPNFCEEHILKMEEIYHPLIEEPVCNTITIDNNCIITGSNASGKSTFIKAVAINVVLAQSIHTCMAKLFSLPKSRILTSMAVRDDLMAGESYYIKEIKYLKRIIENLNEERLMICCIDEILRGTNTEERIAASVAILRYLLKKKCIAIVATHDIQLLQMLNERYDTYHFREQIDEKDIHFDYQIHEGVSYTKNAIRLLQYVDFPNEIIEDAKKSFVATV